MKKQMTVLVALFTLIALPSMAGKVADNCGCGVGTMALGEEDGFVSHLAATFLNGLSGNQTLGVVSGTLGCDQSLQIVSSPKVKAYVADNMDALVGDIAMGTGESLHGLADIMDVEGEQRLAMFDTLQTNFDSIYASDSVTADQVVANIAAVL